MGQLQERYKNYREPQKYMAAGVYPYFREITSKQMTEVTDIDGHKILMFGSNAYQGLTNDQRVIDAAKAALDKYGSVVQEAVSSMVRSICTCSSKRSLLNLWARMKLCVSLQDSL